MQKPNWRTQAKRILKAEMKRRDIAYKTLACRLGDSGLDYRSLTNKISRGRFSAAFFLQALTAMGVKEVRLDV